MIIRKSKNFFILNKNYTKEKVRYMETFKFENKELKKGISNRIIYFGCLSSDMPKPEYIYMHLGYGISWDNLQEIKLKRYYDNYEADITFDEVGEVYFCFRTSDNKWDNNFGNNYKIQVEKTNLDQIYSIAVPMEIPKQRSIYLIKRNIRLAFYRLMKFARKIFRVKLKRRNYIKEDFYE